MGAEYILRQCAQKLGAKLPAQRDWLLEKVNQAAFELWKSDDLTHSVLEQVFEFDTENSQLTLPHYVGEVRGLREYNSGVAITLKDMRPRYNHYAWNSVGQWKYRVRGISPILRDLENSAPLTVTLVKPELIAVNVTITGATEFSARLSETVTIAAGATSGNTVANFFPSSVAPQAISEIKKDIVTKHNVEITDADGELIAVIPSNELSTRYTLVEIGDKFFNWSVNHNCVEVLFKLNYRPFVVDTDEYPVSGYDDTIMWKVLENNATKIEDAIAFRKKASSLKSDLATDTEVSLDQDIKFGNSRYFGDFTVDDQFVSPRRCYGPISSR